MKKLLLLLFFIPFLFSCDNDDDKKKEAEGIVSIKFVDLKQAFSIGETFKFNVEHTPNEIAAPKYKWESTNKEVATVDENGLVKALKAGTTTVKATIPGTKFVASIEVRVLDNEVKTNGILLNETVKRLQEGEGFKLSYTIEGEGQKDVQVTWGSSDPTIASVDNAGNVKALKEGVAVVTVGINGTDKIAQCTVNVIEKENAEKEEHVLIFIGNVAVQVNNDEVDARADVFVQNWHSEEITDVEVYLRLADSTEPLSDKLSLGTVKSRVEVGMLVDQITQLGKYVFVCTYKFKGEVHKAEKELLIEAWNPFID